MGFLGFISEVSGQQVSIIQQGESNQSSYYHIARIDSQTIWIGGEDGVLVQLDSGFRPTPVNYPGKGLNILKIERFDRFVFIAAENGTVYRCDLKQNNWKTVQFGGFKNRSFYDFAISEAGNILLCGGNKKVARGQVARPDGFVAVTDTSLKEPRIQRFRNQFVWSVCKQENEWWIATYRPNRTKLRVSEDLKTWKTQKRVSGLVHELQFYNSLKYCGSGKLNVNKTGIYGDLLGGIEQNSGCIWCMDTAFGQVIYGTQTGRLVLAGSHGEVNAAMQLAPAYPVYDLLGIGGRKYLVCGHGGMIWLIDFTEP